MRKAGFGNKTRDWPKNLWLGVSVENQVTDDKRIPLLLQTPAEVRFVSCEPLLGPVDLQSDILGDTLCRCDGCMDYAKENTNRWQAQRIDWVIAGGETGLGARPMHPYWVRSLRDQCQAANVPFFFKSWGEFVRCDYEGKDYGAPYIDSQCIDGELWDLDKCDENVNLYSTGDNLTCPKCKGMEYVRIGKKKSGRILDGRVWEEFPVVRP